MCYLVNYIVCIIVDGTNKKLSVAYSRFTIVTLKVYLMWANLVPSWLVLI